MKLIARAIAVGAVLTFTLTGCGGDDDTTSSSSDSSAGTSAPAEETPGSGDADRSALRAALLEQLNTGTELDAGSEKIADCVIDGMDDDLTTEDAIRVATDGPDATNAAEVEFGDLLLDCLE